MNKLEIPARNIEVDYPSTWDEIPLKHVKRIGEIMHMAYTGKIDYDMARKLAVDLFINRVNSPNKPVYGEESLNYWGNEAQLADSVNFLFVLDKNKKGVETVSINPKFCTQLVTEVKVGDTVYTGPKDLLADLTIFEWKEASWRVGKYAKTLDDGLLDEIFEVLYKREKAEGRRLEDEDKRQKEKDKNGKDKKEEPITRRIPIGIKFMVYLFFLGCMNWIREESIEIDGEEICFGCLFPKGKEGDKVDAGDNTGIAGILFQMAESGVFGNMEQTSKVSMWDVFLRLYQIHHQMKRMK